MNEVEKEKLRGISFEDMKNDPEKTKYVDEIVDGFRVLVMRGPCALTAYVGVPLGHKLAYTERDYKQYRRWWKRHNWYWRYAHWLIKLLFKEPLRRWRIEQALVGKIPNYDIDLRVHGGVTYSQMCDMRGAGYWWYGWDYGHYGDESFMDLGFGGGYGYPPVAGYKDALEAIEQLKRMEGRP